MEDVFLSIQERIAESLPELSLVDEDYGQLITEGDTYPVTFPCVLIGNIEADWQHVGLGAEKGVCTVTIKLAIDCYNDTHYSSGTSDKIRERLNLNRRVYLALQGFRSSREMSALIRVKSTDYSLPGGIKVYETVFQFTCHDESALTRP